MFKRLYLLSVRNLLKNKGFTIINILGLSVGLTVSLLILLWVHDELSYEKFNKEFENIYRVEEDQFYSGERYHVTVTPHPSGPVWKEKIPEIKEQTRINRLPRVLFRNDDRLFFESSAVAADTGLFRIFTMPFVSGDPSTALRDPHSIVISEEMAKKYFGDTEPLGKSLTIENKYQFMVTGIMKDLPRNSMFTFNAVVPYSFLSEIGAMSNSWGNNSILTFVLLERNPDIDAINKKLTDVVLEYLPETTTKYVLFPLSRIHLHTKFGYDTGGGGAATVVWVFSLIAFFVLLIACINFINLSTAKASGRAREIGIKKVSGATQLSIIGQFLLESLILVFIAVIISVVLIGLSLNVYNTLTGKLFGLADIFTLEFISMIILTGLIAALLSGIYPAFYLASFQPVSVLKGDPVTGKNRGFFRRTLVIIQFTLSGLIAAIAIFMFMQFRFLQNKDLGFERKNLLSVVLPADARGKYYSFKNELLNESVIEGVTASRSHPVRMGSNSGGADWDGRDPEKRVLIGTNAVDYDYLSTMKMKLVEGRDFSREFVADMAKDTTGNFLVNEEVVKIMGVDNAVGQRFSFMGLHGRIAGVLRNFNFKGADQPIEPIAFALGNPSFLNFALIRIAGTNISEEIKIVENTWNSIVPEFPFEYTFVDEDYNSLYGRQLRLSQLLQVFTIITILIACIGLYGLSAYSTVRRTNEIGIRKVMGAGRFSIIITMVKEWMLPILISIIIAIPAGAFILSKLLLEFAERIDLNPLVFILIASGTVLIALVTVSFQAFIAAGISPSSALKQNN